MKSFIVNPNIKVRITSFGNYLYNPEKECVHELNATAYIIWSLCDSEIILDDIIKQICDIYAIPTNAEIIKTEIMETVCELVDKGLLSTGIAEPSA